MSVGQPSTATLQQQQQQLLLQSLLMQTSGIPVTGPQNVPYQPERIGGGISQHVGMLGMPLDLLLGQYLAQTQYTPLGTSSSLFHSFMRQSFDAIHARMLQQSAARDAEVMAQVIRGLATIPGIDAGQRNMLLEQLRNLYVNLPSPELQAAIANIFTGGRSEMAAAARFHVAGRSMTDPVSGATGLSPATSVIMSQVLSREFFSNYRDNLRASGGMTSQQLADAWFELYRRGIGAELPSSAVDRIVGAMNRISTAEMAPDEMMASVVTRVMTQQQDRLRKQLGRSLTNQEIDDLRKKGQDI
jgi:hypothetical protein